MHCRYYYTFRHVYAETYLALEMKKMKEKKKERKEKKARLHVRDSVAIVGELRWYRVSESWPGRWTVSLEIPMQPSPVVRTTAGATSDERRAGGAGRETEDAATSALTNSRFYKQYYLDLHDGQMLNFCGFFSRLLEEVSKISNRFFNISTYPSSFLIESLTYQNKTL